VATFGNGAGKVIQRKTISIVEGVALVTRKVVLSLTFIQTEPSPTVAAQLSAYASPAVFEFSKSTEKQQAAPNHNPEGSPVGELVTTFSKSGLQDPQFEKTPRRCV
jgi:hypothetical protein